MALNTLATNATLSALVNNPSATAAHQADIASLRALILNDYTGLHVVSAWEQGPDGGLLYIPRRGVLKMFAGDWIAVDGTGWPILLSSTAAASAAAWTHVP